MTLQQCPIAPRESPAPAPPEQRLEDCKDSRSLVRDILAGMSAGRVSWLWVASMVAGLAWRWLARKWRKLVFRVVVQPVFFLVQLLVYLMVVDKGQRKTHRPIAPDAANMPKSPPTASGGDEPASPPSPDAVGGRCATAGNGKVAVIIPNYRGEHFLPGLLESLARQTWPNLEVLVVDNDSQDGSEAVVRRFPNARWIPTGANRGFAHAVNRGAREAGDAEFLALLNNDTEVEPDWARSQVEALRADPRLGMVGARIYQKGFDRRINIHAHVLGSDLRSYNLGAGDQDHGQWDDGGRVLGVSGCSMMIRGEAFRDVGEFDERFFLCYEDLDFSLRMFWRGWDCRVVHEAVCHHVSNAHLETGSATHVRNILQNDLLWLMKDIPGDLMARYGGSFLASVLRSDEIRLFYRWQGCKIALWRLQSLVKLFGALRARRAVQRSRLRGSDDLSPFLRPIEDLQIGRLYQVDLAERYLVSQAGPAARRGRRELFPLDVLAAENFAEPADLASGTLTTNDDPHINFLVGLADRGFRRVDVEMTSDQPGWAQFMMVCRRLGAGSYCLPSNHFRVIPGRHRYAFPINAQFFLDHHRTCPDLLGYWQDDLQYLRLDPCEARDVRVAIHAIGVS